MVFWLVALLPIIFSNLLALAATVLILGAVAIFVQNVILPAVIYGGAFLLGLFVIYVVFKQFGEGKRLQTRTVALAMGVFLLLAGGTLLLLPSIKQATGVKLFSVAPDLMSVSTTPAPDFSLATAVTAVMPFLWIMAIALLAAFSLMLIWRPKKVFGKR